MIIEGLEQRSPEWMTMRNGCVTGSRVADVCAKLKKGGPAACRQNYLIEVAVSRLTGLAPDRFVTPAMQWGIDNEQFARAAYEMQADCMVESIGFAIHPRLDFFGASPDGLIGKDGVLELKCPTSDTHLGYILGGVLPLYYMPQMLAEMACTERQWCDFVSFDPRMPKNLQLFVRRFQRDDELITALEVEVAAFLLEVDALLEQIEQASPCLLNAG